MSDCYILTGGKIVEYQVLVEAISKEDALRKAEAGEILMEEVIVEYDHQFDDEILTQYEYLEKKGKLDNG
jgi:hypothetical protein